LFEVGMVTYRAVSSGQSH